MKMKLTRPLMIFAAILVLSGGLTVYAATTLFTQSFPAQTFATGDLIQGSSCSGGNLAIDSTGSNIPSFAGNPAQITFACAPGAHAFSSSGTTSTTVTVTPTFTIPAGWTLGVSAVTDPLTSGPCTAPTVLASGTSVTLQGGTLYDYCLETNSASTYSSFSITWAQ